jgi:hypothetical protein
MQAMSHRRLLGLKGELFWRIARHPSGDAVENKALIEIL